MYRFSKKKENRENLENIMRKKLWYLLQYKVLFQAQII